MKINRYVFLLVLLTAGYAQAYDGTVHPIVTEQALTFLSNNKSYASGFLSTGINGTTFREIIKDGANDPDRPGKGLTNDEVNNNSSLKTYNFEASLNKDIDNAVSTLFSGLYPFVAIAPGTPLSNTVFGIPTFKKVVDAAVKAAISAAPDPSITKLKQATQHTYVKGEGMFGDTFNDISISPFCAQAEYNLAVKAWFANDKAEAMRRLGRVLHYIQDITVPHHISLDINIPDVARAAVEYVKVGSGSILANSSQTRYEEGTAYSYITGTFNQGLLQNSVSLLQNNDDKGRSIPDVLIGIRSQIQQSGMMGMVDGYSNGGLAKKGGILSWARKLWNQIVQKVTTFVDEVVAELKKLKDALVQGARSTAAKQLQQVVEEHLNSTYKYKDVNDNMTAVAAKLVPIAIVESAKLLDRFVSDVNAGQGVCGAGQAECTRGAVKLYRMSLTCRGALVNDVQTVDLTTGYSNYTCGNRWKEHCIDDGTFDGYYMEWCGYAGPTCVSKGNKQYSCDPGAKPTGTCKATVLHRTTYRCDGTLQYPETTVDLTTGYRHFTCDNQFKKSCVQDGSWDGYYSEWCEYTCN